MTLRRHPRRAGGDGAPGRTAAGPEERSLRRAPQTATDTEEPAGPTDVQVWHWAQSAVSGGYGPSASSFQPPSPLSDPRTPADRLAP